MSIAKHSFIFAVGTFLSRISGLIREMVVSSVFGASAAMDAFNVAYRIPNLLRDMLAEGALSNAFTKVFTETAEINSDRAKQFLVEALILVTMFVGSFCIVGMYFSDTLVSAVANGNFLNPAQKYMTVKLTQVIFPYLLFASLGALGMGALFQRQKFFLSAFAPSIFNVFNILGAVWIAFLLRRYVGSEVKSLWLDIGILGLAIGVVIGGFFHFLLQWIPLRKSVAQGIGLSFRLFPLSREFRKVLKLMFPMVIATSAGPINAVVNTNFATSLGTGAVSWLNYAFRLIQLPVGIFAVAVGSVALPTLVRTIKLSGDKYGQEVARDLSQSLYLVLWLTVPCAVFIYQAALPLTELLFQQGLFSSRDAVATSQVMAAYAFCILGYGVIKVLTAYFYAIDKTIYPMMVSLICILLNFLANSFFVHRFQHVGLAVSSSITLSLNALFLFLVVRKFGLKWNIGMAKLRLGSLMLSLFVAGIYCLVFGKFNIKIFVAGNLGTQLKIQAAWQCLWDGFFIGGIFFLGAIKGWGISASQIFQRLRLVKRKY